MIRRLFLTCCLLLAVVLACPAQREMPIIAYMGVPHNQTSDKNFKTFSECGFNVSLSVYGSISQMQEACRIAHQYGVSILGHCSESHDSPQKAAAAMKNVQGFFGYFLRDEPTADDIRTIQKEIEQLKKADDSHCFYVNLHPYHDRGTLGHLKTSTYQAYLDTVSAVPCQQLSFDFYPVTTKGIRPTWYYNLEMVRQESLRTGKPFWGFVLSVPHDVPFDEGNYYPAPTLAALRLQVYSNLAYGAQAIQYFTYWTPDGTDSFHYHDGPIGLDGKKTKTYDVVQQMNRELKAVAPLFYGAKVLSVHHLGAIPEGTTRQTVMPLNIRSLKIVGRQGAIISQLQKDGHRYLAIVNKSHEQPLTVRIQPRNSTPRHLTKQLQAEALKTSYTVTPGDVLLFRLK